MILENIEGLSFDFPDAIDVFKFDETDASKPTFHGAPMKAVDLIVEMKEIYLFIEIKNYNDPGIYDIPISIDRENPKKKRDHFNQLKDYLKYKFRDTYLYRYAEDKVDKPILYLCIINFDNTLNSEMCKFLRYELPVGKPTERWKREIVQNCHVLNIAAWNKRYPKWPVSRYSA